jgi:hypothetical protein
VKKKNQPLVRYVTIVCIEIRVAQEKLTPDKTRKAAKARKGGSPAWEINR